MAEFYQVPCARWVVDGNIWTSSGGMDMTWAFLAHAVGLGNTTIADRAANILGYEVHKDPSWDPYCVVSLNPILLIVGTVNFGMDMWIVIP